MKKRLILLVLLFPVVLHAQLTDRLTVNPNEIGFEKQDGFDRIKYGTEYLQEPGNPELPVVSRSFVIPTGAEVSGIEVEITNERKLEGSYYLYPVQPPQIVGESTRDFVKPSRAYLSATVFPDNAAFLSFDGMVQGYHVITVSYYPVGYLPQARELYLRDLSVTVNYGLGGNPVESARGSYNRAMLSKAFVKSMVQNPTDVELYYDESAFIPPTTVMDRLTGNSQERSLNVIGETVPDYVIITCDSLKDSYKRLADWKTRKGVPTIIKCVEEIDNSYTGSDLAEKIRNYLIDVKKRWNGNGLFVLLGGDTNIIPTRMVKGDIYKSPLYAADFYFVADNVSGWNPVSSTINSTYETSSFLGRLPLQNIRETDIFIDKLLSYEKANIQGVDYSYFRNSLIIDAYGEVSKNRGVTGDSTYCSYGNMSDIYRYCQNRDKEHNYWYLFDHVGCVDPKHIHKDPGSYDTSKAEELNKNSFMSAWSNGKAFGKFHFVYHLDHSMQSNMGTSWEDKGSNITNEEVDNIPDDRYPKVILSGGCHPARFEKDCIAERFLKKTYGGAVAFIGNTDVGYFDEPPQLNNFLNAAFSDNIFSTYQFSIGYLYKKATATFTYRKWKLHLLGDPEMPVWTTAPKQLQVTTNTQSIGNGQYKITVQIANLPSGQQALICLMKGEEGYATLTVSDNKPNDFTFTPLTSGMISVTVTAHNFKPYESTIPIQSIYSSALRVSGCTFLDGTTPNSIGNSDGRLDAGETVELNVKLKNTGRNSVNVIAAQLFCNRPDLIEIRNDRALFGMIPAQGELSSSENFRIKIDENIGGTEVLKNDFNSVRFTVVAYSNLASYTDSFKVDLFAGQPELTGQTFVPDGSTSGKYYMYVNVTNTGKSTLTGLKGVLVPDDAGSLVDSCPYNTSVFPDIAPEQTMQNTFQYTFVVKKGYLTGNPLKMKLKLTNAYEKTWELPLDPVDVPAKVGVQGITVQSNGYGVRLCWQNTNKAATYNVYRSYADIPASYTKLNDRPLSSTYFQDENYQPLRTYYYKVEAVSASGNVGEKSESVKVTTHPELVANFPKTTTQRCSAGGIAVEDVDNDGYKEIIVTGTTVGDTNRGFLSVLNYKGEELFHESGNSMDGVGEMVTGVTASPSVGNLLGDGGRQIVTTTWNDGSDGNVVDCFVPEDKDGNRQADRLWQNVIKSTMHRGAVLANLDNSADGSMETLVRSNTRGTTLKVLDNKGRLKKEIGQSGRYSRPAVADLDDDGDLEIIVCYDLLQRGNNTLRGEGMFIWHHDGTPYGQSPFWGRGISLCSPVISTLNNGDKVAFVAETLARNSRIFAIRLNGVHAGEPLSDQWNGNVRIPYSDADNSGLDHMVSVGDINGDGQEEVVALGINTIKAWDLSGKELFTANEPQLFSTDEWSTNIQAPILADVDGDNIADIIYAADDRVCALKGDGNKVSGFPLYTNMPAIPQLCVADIDYDGKNELIAMDSDAQIFMWQTQGKATAIEWGSERHDPQSTGEYGPICESKIIKFDTTSNGITPCGNIIIRSGKYTIPSGVNLPLNLHSMIVVRSGAILEINGGTLSNANVLAVPGSRIVLKNGGKIQLRDGCKMKIDKGATFSNQGGRIETIY